jgi:hypothetical protein
MAVNGLAQALKFYAPNNKMMERFYKDVEELFAAFFAVANAPLQVRVASDTFFLNGHIVRLDFVEFEKCRQLSALIEAAGFGEVALPQGTSPASLTDLFQALRASASNPEMRERLLRDGVAGVTLRLRDRIVAGATGRSGKGALRLGRADLMLRLYAALVAESARLVEAVQRDRPPDLAKAHRALRLAAENMAEAADLVLALVSTPWEGPPLGRHGAHTALLAMALGSRLELGLDPLVEIGVAGFLHDVGRYLVAERLPSPLEDLLFLPEPQRGEFLQLPETAVPKMLSWPGASPVLRAALVVAYENRLDFAARQLYDGKTEPHPYTSLIGVADRYDSVLLGAPDSPARAGVEVVARQSGNRLHPEFARHLLQMTGPYPPATPVALSSGELAMVLHPSPGADDGDRPVVLPLTKSAGRYLAGNPTELTGSENRVVRSLPRRPFGALLRGWYLAHRM